MEHNTYRTFIAIEIPTDLRSIVIAHLKALRDRVPNVSASWSRENNLHLTLKFLGDVPAGRLEAVSAAAASAAQASAPFEVSIAGCGVFPPRGKPTVLWIGIEDANGGLQKVQRRLEDECAARSFARDTRAYQPHLTIARIKKPQGAKDLAEAHLHSTFPLQSLRAKELVVFRSELLPQGSGHTPISRHLLG